MTSILFSKMISIFIMLVIGWICSQLAIVDKSTKDKLTVLSTQIVTPCLVFMSFQIEFDAHLLQNMGIAFAVSMLIHVGAIFASRFAIRNDGKHDNAVERLMLIYTNCGFMGFPLAYAVAGNEGVIYATTYNAAFTIFVWTQGIGMFRDKGGSFSWRKVLNPAIIATVLGLLCFLIRFYVPESVGFALDSIGDMNTPLAMIIAVGIGYAYARNEGADGISCGILSLISFLIVSASSAPAEGGTVVTGVIPRTWTGGNGVIAAILVGLLVGKLFSFCHRKRLRIRMP